MHSGGSNSGKFSKSSSPHSTSSSAWQELLEQEASTWITVLVTEEVQRALRRSDIDKVVELIEVLPSGLKASEQMGLYKDRIDTVTRAFYASLFSTVSPQYERLYDPKLREKIRMQVVNKISDAHAKVHQLVSNEFHGYDSSILTHSIEEVNVLLGSTTEGDGNTDRMMQ